MPHGAPTLVRGIAFGGDSAVAKVDLSIDGGSTWTSTRLGKDEGKYSFRQWETPGVLSPDDDDKLIACYRRAVQMLVRYGPFPKGNQVPWKPIAGDRLARLN